MEELNLMKSQFNIKEPEFRIIQIIRILDILRCYEFYYKTNVEKINVIAGNIEKSCYNKSIELAIERRIHISWKNLELIKVYNNLCFEVNSRLEIEEFALKIFNNEFDSYKIAYISAKQVVPEKYEEIENVIKIRNQQHVQHKVSHRYKCPKCKKNSSIVHDVQTRSLDEAPTTSALCTFCGNKWVAA